jgi:ABC-type sugar transport system substrate-binding protein
MIRHSRRIEFDVVRISWAGRLVTALFAVMLFVLMLTVSALAAAVGVAIAIVVGARLWWLSCRDGARQDAGNRVGRTFVTDYEVVSSESGPNDSESGKVAEGESDARTTNR